MRLNINYFEMIILIIFMMIITIGITTESRIHDIRNNEGYMNVTVQSKNYYSDDVCCKYKFTNENGEIFTLAYTQGYGNYTEYFDSVGYRAKDLFDIIQINHNYRIHHHGFGDNKLVDVIEEI